MTNAQANFNDILKNDSVIRDLIGNRKSIVPAGKITGKTVFPAIAIREGSTFREGSHLNTCIFDFRVYDNLEDDAINISKIGWRLMELFDNKEMELDRGRFIKMNFDSSLGFMEDQALKKNFIEYRYKVQAV